MVLIEVQTGTYLGEDDIVTVYVGWVWVGGRRGMIADFLTSRLDRSKRFFRELRPLRIKQITPCWTQREFLTRLHNLSILKRTTLTTQIFVKRYISYSALSHR